MDSEEVTLAAGGDEPEPGAPALASPTGDPDPARRPERIGRFTILDVLGAGGMGIVYAAYDPELDRKVALKLIRPGRADASARVRLVREAQAMARLSHPNVVAVYDTGSFGSSIYLVMEHVEGETLDGWLAAARRSWEAIRAAFLEIGRGVAAAHAVGLIHRDLKPGNVLVAASGRFKVADFGLARGSGDDERGPTPDERELAEAPEPAPTEHPSDDDATLPVPVEAPKPASAEDPGDEDATLPAPVDAATDAPAPSSASTPRRPGADEGETRSSLHSRSSLDSALTLDGAMLGTPRYMAPEQVRGERGDASSDQFSFCVALYEALYGELPYPGDNLAQRYQAIVAGELRPAPSDNPTPSWLRAVVVRGLAAEGPARWPSMSALLEALAHDPRRRRRRLAMAGGFVALLAGAVALGTLFGPKHDAQCTGAEAELAGVWDRDRRAAVRARFEASELAYAKHTAEVVERELDGYAEAWTKAWTDACEATRVRAVQSEALLDARMRCLDGRRRELEALSEGLAQPLDDDEDERRILERAIAAVSALPSVAPCSDPEYLDAAIPPPDDPAALAELDELREALALARSQRHFGAYDEAEASLLEGRERAEAIDYPLALVEHDLALGRVHVGQGRYEDAEAKLRAGLLEAEAIGADELARDAAIELSLVVGVHRGEAELAGPWSAMAEAKLRRRETPAARADFLHSRGSLLRFEGDYAGAIEAFEQARAIQAREQGERSYGVARLWNELGTTHNRTGDFEQAVAALERARELYEELLGAEHPEVATILNNIGAAYSDHKTVEAALPYLERALAIRELSLPPEHPAIGASLVNLGNVHLGNGEYEQAIANFERARELLAAGQGEAHPNVAVCLINLSVAHGALGDREAQREASEQAIAIFEKSAPDSPNLAIPVVNLGHNRLAAGEPEQALALFERARDHLERTAGPDHFRLLEALAALAMAQLELGRLDEAIASAERGLNIADESESQQPIRRANLEFVLARALVEGGGDRDRARELATTARDALATAGEGSASQREEIDAWLAETF